MCAWVQLPIAAAWLLLISMWMMQTSLEALESHLLGFMTVTELVLLSEEEGFDLCNKLLASEYPWVTFDSFLKSQVFANKV